MFLYYLIDLNRPQPMILYCAIDQSLTTTDILKLIGQTEIDGIVYSRVPLTEVCGLENLCQSRKGSQTQGSQTQGSQTQVKEKNIYFFHLNGSEFYYSIGQDLTEAHECLKVNLTKRSQIYLNDRIQSGFYDSWSFDQMIMTSEVCQKWSK